MFHRVMPRSPGAATERAVPILPEPPEIALVRERATATFRLGDISRLVREALASQRLRIGFQRIAMLTTVPHAASHEGFVQLLDEAGSLIPASRFMGAVEESSLGRDLDVVVLRLGWQALRAHPSLRLALNVSARSLGNAAWRATLEEGVTEFGHRLTLEVGEGSTSLLANRVARFMEELRPRGLNFVLDGFGVGPLSLRQLRDLRFDGVKVDDTFVRNIDASLDNQALVGALVSVAHRFGMFAIAKGVETGGEAAQLRALGVDGLQGYLFGRSTAEP